MGSSSRFNSGKPLRSHVASSGIVVFAAGLIALFTLRISAEPIPASLTFGQATTENWAGYAVTPAAGSAVTSVSGTWVVPTVTGGGLIRGDVAFWVGMDGYSNQVVEQIGIASTVNPSTYTAWFEMYPAAAQNISMIVLAGDTMHAQVDYLGSNQYQLSIDNVTRGLSFSTVQLSAEEEPRSSGEWIAELVGFRLGNFGSMTFSNASATLDNGTPGAISSFPYDSIDMAPPTGPGAVAGPLDSSGTSFTITVPEPVGMAAIAIAGLALFKRRARD